MSSGLTERERSSVLAAKTLAETLSGMNSTPQTEASATGSSTESDTEPLV